MSLATSVDVERVFSYGGLLVSYIRNRLSAQTTRALLCLGQWSLLGFIHDNDVLKVTQLPEGPRRDDHGEGDVEFSDGWDTIDSD
jgi:hypothetical protein